MKKQESLRWVPLTLVAVAATASIWLWAWEQAAASDRLAEGFRNPPPEAWPRTWWHWTNGNVTKEGITQDLEWMKRVGIAGFQLADVATGGGQEVEKKVVFGSPEWLDAVRHAAQEADRLGLEMAIFSSAGWSLTGGPWVKPEQAMKKLVWSELTVEGPSRFAGKLPQPPAVNGPIRNLERGGARPANPPDPTYYADAAVIAFPVGAEEGELVSAGKPAVRTSGGGIDAGALLDEDLNSGVSIKADGGVAWIEYAYEQPVRVRAFTVAGRNGIPFGRLLASEDGREFIALCTLPGAQLYRGGTVRTFAVPETRSRVFRLELTGAPMRPAAVMSQEPPQAAPAYELTEFKLHSGSRVHRWEEKAGFSFLFEYETVPTPPSLPPVASRSQVVDLTQRMKPGGHLEWEVPAGRWRIVRFGYSLTGAKNRPAVPAGLGYEADKLSREHMEAYLEGYFAPLRKALGPLLGRSLRYIMADSWEAGTQNWSENLLKEFQVRRGYDPRPYLPVLAGYVVDSPEVSDRFLWDFRRTLADLFADNHYGVIADFARRHGMGVYSEAAGVSLEIPEDTLLNKSKVDIPMGEFWVRALHPESMYYVDVRGAASAAHIFGKPFVAAEAFTGGGYEAPFTLKRVADYWFAQGVNRLVFHTSAHQPLNTKPGNVMVGTHLHRNITWAELARPFNTYLARICWMLQQGRFVADLAYLLNEGAPSTMPFWGAGLQPAPPRGYDFDYLNAATLLEQASVDAEGNLVLRSGMKYRVLVLPETRRMRPAVLKKIRELVLGGLTVVGPKPEASPSLADYPEGDRQVRAMAEELWGDLDGVSRNRRALGKGNVYWGLPLERVLAGLKTPPDVEYSRPLGFELVWIHRKLDEAEIYFLANRSERPADIEASFRVSGRDVQLWRPDSGQVEPASYEIQAERTRVALHFEPWEAYFVVFRGKAGQTSRRAERLQDRLLAELKGPWKLSFPPGWGAPASVELEELVWWNTHPDDGVKYFSGTATYVCTFTVRPQWLARGAQVWLDLGEVRDIAEVRVNGKPAGLLWKPPHRLEVSGLLRSGRNELEVRVTNQWTNRITGDRSLPPEKRVLKLPAGPGAAMMPAGARMLADSGMRGPVRLFQRAVDLR